MKKILLILVILNFARIFCAESSSSSSSSSSAVMPSSSSSTLSENNEKLIRAAQQGRLQDVKKLLDSEGVNVDAVDEEGLTALVQAVIAGHEDIVKLLLDHKADVNFKRSSDGYTPLIAAAGTHFRKASIVKLLLDHKADINSRRKDGRTALGTALYYGYKDITKILLDHGADPNIGSNWSKGTPLRSAAADGHLDLVKMLIEHGANVNTLDRYGNSILMRAIDSEVPTNKKEIVQFLIENGADVNVKSKFNKTALSIAIKNGRKEIAELLRKSGATEPTEEQLKIS